MNPIIRNTVLTAALLCMFTGCTAQQAVPNQEVTTEKDGKMLLGTQTKDQLLKAPFSEWYAKEHEEYALDKTAVPELMKSNLNDYQITLVMGTWCEDSHREVPRLMKILETVKFPDENLTMIAVDRQKKSPAGEEEKFRIEKVPTVIVQKDGKEVGRITESPTSGWLERDLLQIIK
ncbi:TlpA family protein disulfide reductase [Chryseobacterium sp.]|uniref:TlpA family protein disulfide reductase n=1 Tax=Chryseobacterium sp. TaxID=1871047 RepID=UPI0011CA97B3|nr:thioredoxin family protein [Chryseobacterium sp.]TXF79434.1 thioredoxin family protein [Chryseobacterium sp.]